MQRMEVPRARRNSWEELFHEALGGKNGLFLSHAQGRYAEAFLQPRGQRAIGVVYHPLKDNFSNYVPTVLPRRYDALIYLDQTQAVHPIRLSKKQRQGGLDPAETFPSAV